MNSEKVSTVKDLSKDLPLVNQINTGGDLDHTREFQVSSNCT